MDAKGKRINAFDWLRAYGCLAIVLLHVVSAWKDDPIYSDTFYNSGVLRNAFNNAIVPLLVRAAVPIFFMISGALFLDKARNVSWNSTLQHVRRILSVLIVFGYPMSLIELVVKNKGFEFSYLWEGLLNLIQERTWSHLWYLYATVGLYLLTPLLRAWLNTISEKTLKQILLGSIILFSLIPTVNSVFNLEITTFGISTPNGALLCYLTGHFLYLNRDEIMKKRAVVMSGVAIGGGYNGSYWVAL